MKKERIFDIECKSFFVDECLCGEKLVALEYELLSKRSGGFSNGIFEMVDTYPVLTRNFKFYCNKCMSKLKCKQINYPTP